MHAQPLTTPPSLSGNAIVEPRELHMEVLDTATRAVWQALEPTTHDEYRALEIEAGFVPVGIGRGAMDASWFRRSPGADADGPMDELRIGERRFHFCARPAEGGISLPTGPEGPRQLDVEKHHTVVYRAGRSVGIVRLPDRTKLVHVIEGGPRKAPLLLPDGWKRNEVKLDSDWVVELPCPCLVLFFPNGDSHQGPIEL